MDMVMVSTVDGAAMEDMVDMEDTVDMDTDTADMDGAKNESNLYATCRNQNSVVSGLEPCLMKCYFLRIRSSFLQ